MLISNERYFGILLEGGVRSPNKDTGVYGAQHLSEKPGENSGCRWMYKPSGAPWKICSTRYLATPYDACRRIASSNTTRA